tara:strand:- start:93 stop:644 length:552 start_codon:yes stop_codon:yes gene_type:complete
MKILNLYAGIGGNRKLWGDEHEVTAVELDPKIATIYQDFFPNDKVVVGDAHQYLLEHFREFDFIWSSPPCPTHSRIRYCNKNKVYPDMLLWQEIIFLQNWVKCKWVVENVIPYYKPLINPTAKLSRHNFWSNFDIKEIEFESIDISRTKADGIREFIGFDASRQLVRNCVDPKIAKHIISHIL